MNVGAVARCMCYIINELYTSDVGPAASYQPAFEWTTW